VQQRADWRQVMNDSVFYPGPPVFRDASFIDSSATPQLMMF
jgi:hypothetical protein